MKRKTSLLFFLLIFYSTRLLAQNDNCSTAIALTVGNGTCVNTAGTTVGATQSQVGCAGSSDDDVWYSFVAAYYIETITVTPIGAGALSNAVFEVFSGSCGSLTTMGCVDATTGSSAETSSLACYTAGATYYIHVYSFANGTGQGGGLTFASLLLLQVVQILPLLTMPPHPGSPRDVFS